MELIDTVKEICNKILSVGKPCEGDVLYSEVIKKEIPKESAEELTLKEIKEGITHLFKSNQDTPKNNVTEFSRGTPTPEPIKTPAKKTTKKKPAVKKAIEEKKITTQKQTKKKPAAKKKVTPKGSKRDEKIALYIKDIKKHYGEVDKDFVAIIVKNLGPSIYRKDAELVSCSNPKELNTVRKNFLIKKLNIEASQEVLDAAIADVCEELKSARNKYRATFYYALAKKFKKESVLS